MYISVRRLKRRRGGLRCGRQWRGGRRAERWSSQTREFKSYLYIYVYIDK